MSMVQTYRGNRAPHAHRLALAFVVLAAIGVWFAAFVIVLAGPARAASPQYCAFYAREYVRQFDLGKTQAAAVIEIGDKAYYRCLNLDTAPTLPELSAYAGSALDGIDLAEPLLAQGDGAFEEDVGEPSDGGPVIDVVAPATIRSDVETASADVRAPIEEPAAPSPAPNAAAAASPPLESRSGLTPWSPEWRSWCEKHFPNSFDPETGSVIAFEGGRGFC